MTTTRRPRSTGTAETVAWVIAGAVSVSVIVAAAIMPTENGSRRSSVLSDRAPGIAATADTDVIVVPQHGAVPRAEARSVTVALICPLYNAVDDLRGCVKADGSALLAPVTLPYSVSVAERCGQTADRRACAPYEIADTE